MYRLCSRLNLRAGSPSTPSAFHRSSFLKPRSGPYLRHNSSNAATASSTTTKLSSNTLRLVFLASLISGAIGYNYATLQHVEASRDALKNPKYGTPQDFQKAIKELSDAFAANSEVTVQTETDVLESHGFSPNDYHPDAYSPTVVVSPTSTEDVVKIVKIANKYRMPVTVYSGGTSLEGQFRATPVGGICVDVSGMDRILQINEKDSDLIAQPGAGWMNINETLKDMGIPLFFPLDPAPTATLGGMLSNGCSGTNAVRYGTAKGEWFLNATVVLPNGEVIKTRRRARKSSAGFDLTKLFAGAEGTLGIVTEVTIRLAPVLPTSVAVVHFPDVRQATEAARDIINRGVGIQCIELADDEFMRAANLFNAPAPPKYAPLDSLFIKFQGPSRKSLDESQDTVKQIVQKHGATGWKAAKNDQEANDIWTDRKNAFYAGLNLLPGGRAWATDVCVPVSRLPDLIYGTKDDIKKSGIVSHIVGHIGDGNFHALLMFKTDEELEKVRGLVHRMVERAIELDGTCTGEHGVGIGKKEYLTHELGEGTVELMRTIKRAIDPHNLFNPGKLYPDFNKPPAPHEPVLTKEEVKKKIESA